MKYKQNSHEKNETDKKTRAQHETNKHQRESMNLVFSLLRKSNVQNTKNFFYLDHRLANAIT